MNDFDSWPLKSKTNGSNDLLIEHVIWYKNLFLKDTNFALKALQLKLVCKSYKPTKLQDS
jgi:hypothetical protein